MTDRSRAARGSRSTPAPRSRPGGPGCQSEQHSVKWESSILEVVHAWGNALEQPTKKRVRKPKDVRRREIAEAALRIMAKHGYHGTSVARIAREVGISNSALYQHFRNREDVLFAATELLGQRSDEWIAAPTGATAL